MTLLVVTAQVTVLMACGWAASVLLRRRAAALRHLVLLTALVASAAVPAVTPWFPVSLTPVPGAPVATAVHMDVPALSQHSAATPTTSLPEAADTVPLQRGLLALWLAGTVLAMLRLVREAVALSRLSRRAAILDDARWSDALAENGGRLTRRRPVILREGSDDVPIMSWGWWQPQIVVPSSARQWDDAHVRSVVCHEAAHIERRDSLRFAAMELVRALYWWHPLVWITVREARLQAECACDDVVLRQQATPTQYAEQLVGLARLTAFPRTSVVTSTAYTSFLERRITAMLTPTIDRSPVRPIARHLAIASMCVLSLLVAGTFAHAHAESGSLVGTVRPDGGQPLHDVEVVLASVGRADMKVRTDTNGSFELDLDPGSYRVAVRVPGFKRYEAIVDVSAGERVTRDFALGLAALTERVSVVGETDPRATPVELRPDIPVVNQIGVVTIPRRVDDRKAPAYPALLRDAGVQGTVKAAGRVGPDGYVSDVRIVESPHPGLSEVVTQYMTTLRYEPTKVQGTAVATDVVLTIDFRAQR